MYGEDGLDVCKSRYLNVQGIPFLAQNSNCVRTLDLPETGLEAEIKSAQKKVRLMFLILILIIIIIVQHDLNVLNIIYLLKKNII